MQAINQNNQISNFSFPKAPIFNYCLCELLGNSSQPQCGTVTSPNLSFINSTDEYNNLKVIWMKSMWRAQEVWNNKKDLGHPNRDYGVSLNSIVESQGFSNLPNPTTSKGHNKQNFEFTENSNNTDLNSAKNNWHDSKQPNAINLDALKGHKYEIKPCPSNDSHEGNYEYICRYDGCGKSFNKTYNLVYHFRVHTHEKPFQCKYCKKQFSQKGNLGRHLERHNTKTVDERKIYHCNTCSKSYTSIYNLRVSH